MDTGHQLAQLIDSIKAANNWSDPDLVRNAKAKGYTLSKSNISRYRSPLVSIKGDIIRALAAGLRITPAQVAVAALESMGVPVPRYDSPTAEQAVRLDTGLSDRDKESILALLKSLRASAGSSEPSAEVTPHAAADAASSPAAPPAPVIPLRPTDRDEETPALKGVARTQEDKHGQYLAEAHTREGEAVEPVDPGAGEEPQDDQGDIH